jgi:hypothetical protein
MREELVNDGFRRVSRRSPWESIHAPMFIHARPYDTTADRLGAAQRVGLQRGEAADDQRLERDPDRHGASAGERCRLREA